MVGVMLNDINGAIFKAYALGFADDLCVVSPDLRTAQRDFDTLAAQMAAVNLKINSKKTEVMIVRPTREPPESLSRDSQLGLNSRHFKLKCHVAFHPDAIQALTTPIVAQTREILVPRGNFSILCPFALCYYVAVEGQATSPQDLLLEHLRQCHTTDAAEFKVKPHDRNARTIAGGRLGSRLFIRCARPIDGSNRPPVPLARYEEEILSSMSEQECDEGLKHGTERLPTVKHFKYLGTFIAHNESFIKERSVRIQRANSQFRGLMSLWEQRSLKLKTRCMLYNAYVTSTLLTGAGAWTVTEGDIKTLEATYHKHLRILCRMQTKQNADGSFSTPGTVTKVRERCGAPEMAHIYDTAESAYTSRGDNKTTAHPRRSSAVVTGTQKGRMPSQGWHSWIVVEASATTHGGAGASGGRRL